MVPKKSSLSKQAHVEILFSPIGYEQTLLDCTFPPELENYRRKAIEYIIQRESIHVLGKEIISKTKEAYNLQKSLSDSVCTINVEPLHKQDAQEQEEIIKELEKKGKTKREVLERLLNYVDSEPELLTTISNIYKRDNQLIAAIKFVRDSTCQLCGTKIQKRDGTFYIEAAHILPKNQKGPETLKNIILLCPNHHKEFDLGERQILSHTDAQLELELNGRNYSVQLLPEIK